MNQGQLNKTCPLCQSPIQTEGEPVCKECLPSYQKASRQQSGGRYNSECKNAAANVSSSSLEDIENSLNQLVEEWLNLPTAYREQKNSELFYWENIFPKICSLFEQKEVPKLTTKSIDGLILTVGTSPEPLILSISACRPSRVLFLCTKQTEKHLDLIIDKTGLKPSQFDKQLIQETDPLDIYKTVLATWESWGRRKDVAVDITGGTKSMTGGLAMAGALLGLPLLYVAAGEYIPEYRRPRPGTEYLELLPNPYQVFGVLKEREAAELFRRMDFQGACKIYEELAQNVPEPQSFLVLASLTRAYQCWDALDFSQASQSLNKAVELINKYRLCDQWPSVAKTLADQATNLEHLCAVMPLKPGDSTLPLLEDIKALETLLFTVYHCSLRRALQGKWDNASLLLYRLLEIMAQRRLAVKGLDTAAPDYSLLSNSSKDDLLTDFNDIRIRLKMGTLGELPSPIGLMEGYMLLEVLGDPFCLENSEGTGKKIHWRKFLNENKKRNYSILAHGFIFVSEDQYDNFKATVDQLLKQFCLIEGIEFAVGLKEYAFEHPEI